jgi:uncharacterized membrane protein YkvA (DUF1232 family)
MDAAMGIQFTIDISDDDLPYFVEAVQRAEQRASGKTAEEILSAAEKTFASAQDTHMPEFVRSRLATVSNLVAMVRDTGWALSDEDKERVVGALTYFADPEDLIPDNIPVLGFLDDAIMIEVVERVLQPEIEAYADFCLFREQEAQYRGADAATLGREEWLEGRRAELQARMRQRRTSYAPSANWRPTFRVS